ncbi:MAG: hypothetical protein V1906_01240 [Candidatus Woesearchaeota archaeon]
MTEFSIVSENPITLADLKDRIAKIEKRDKELNFRGNKTKDYLAAFNINTLKEVAELKKKIEDLNIPRLKDRHIMKLIDIHPADMDSLKMLISAETITVKEEDLKKILALL